VLTNYYTILYTFYRFGPEVFYPGLFVKIGEPWPPKPPTYQIVSSLFHSTHFKEMMSICDGKDVYLKGNPKKWRKLDYKPYDETHCSYYMYPGQSPKPITSDKDDKLGPVLWFSTRGDDADKYGPCQFEFKFKSVVEAYQKSRGRSRTICYRAAGTLVYQGEVSKVVLMCCKEDEEHNSFPLITGSNTKYFTLPVEPHKDSSHIEMNFQIMINNYNTTSRHEHVILAVYLPEYRKLRLTNEDGLLRLTTHNEYCIKGKTETEIQCIKKEDKVPITIDKLRIILEWIRPSIERDTLDNHYSLIDQSIEEMNT